MKSERNPIRSLWAYLATALLMSLVNAAPAAAPAFAEARVAVRVRAIRSLTYYTPDTWAKFSLPPFEAALDDIQRLGGNSVWLILPWHAFEPVALPEPQWDQAALAHLEQAVTAAEKRGMNVIAPLCYVGEGWAPKGIDYRIWTVNPAMYRAFSRYALDMSGKLGAHRNLIYLLYTEGCEPKMESLRQYPEAVASFRAWCRARSGDLGTWNTRWGTKYADWSQVQPINYATDRGNWQRVQDHYRWVASILQESHGGLARKIRAQIKGKALLGYHDYSLIARDWGKGGTPIPPDQPYDFLSLASYDDPNTMKTTAQYQAALRASISRARQWHPALPLAVLETGASSSDVGLEGQAERIRMIAEQARLLGVGVNIWMWKEMDFPNPHRASYGLRDKAGQPKPAYDALKNAWSTPLPPLAP